LGFEASKGVGVGLGDYQGVHDGETIYVFGSGATLNYLAPSFFDDKICVATNFAGSVFGLGRYYVFSHYHADAVSEALLDETVCVFTPQREHGTDADFLGFLPKVVTFPTTTGRPGGSFNPSGKDWPTLDNSLVIGSSSDSWCDAFGCASWGEVHCAWLGLIVVTLGGAERVEGYVQGDTPWALYESHLRDMKQRLWDVYGCQVYSPESVCELQFGRDAVSWSSVNQLGLEHYDGDKRVRHTQSNQSSFAYRYS
jgi:hypothetical protein